MANEQQREGGRDPKTTGIPRKEEFDPSRRGVEREQGGRPGGTPREPGTSREPVPGRPGQGTTREQQPTRETTRTGAPRKSGQESDDPLRQGQSRPQQGGRNQ